VGKRASDLGHKGFGLSAGFTKTLLEAGCDEAGRGCLAGPVVAAAVILPRAFNHPLLNDSKKLTEAQRKILRPIIESEAIAWAVSFISPAEIDEINILNASFLGMHRALDQLRHSPELILIDGNRFHAYSNIAHECIIKGDGKFRSIAAASILAKTHRDEYMIQLSKQLPGYNWERNKGYPTKDHRQAIRLLGANAAHRISFTLLPEQRQAPFKG